MKDENPENLETENPEIKKSILERPPNIPQSIVSSFFGRLNSYKKKKFLYIIGSGGNSFSRVSVAKYGRVLVGPDLNIEAVNPPIVSERTGAHIYFTVENCPHTVTICKEALSYYNSIDQLRGKVPLTRKKVIMNENDEEIEIEETVTDSLGRIVYEPDVIPELVNKANEYLVIDEMVKARKTTPRDMFMIFIVLMAGIGLGFMLNEAMSEDGDSYEIGGNYTETNNPNNPPNNNNNNNNNNNGNPVIIP